MELFVAIVAIAMLVLTVYGRSATSDELFTTEELRLGGILRRIEGVGNVDVMFSAENSGGVLVVAEGAENMEVYLRLQYAIKALTGAELSEIEIVPYGE